MAHRYPEEQKYLRSTEGSIRLAFSPIVKTFNQSKDQHLLHKLPGKKSPRSRIDRNRKCSLWLFRCPTRFGSLGIRNGEIARRLVKTTTVEWCCCG